MSVVVVFFFFFFFLMLSEKSVASRARVFHAWEGGSLTGCPMS